MNRYKCLFLLLVLFVLGGCSLVSEENQKAETPKIAVPFQDSLPLGDETESTPSSVMGYSMAETDEIQIECTEMSLLFKEVYQAADREPSPYMNEQEYIKQDAIDQIEDILIDEGYPVINSDGFYPSYLENAEGIQRFWASVTENTDDQAAYWGVSRLGGLYYRAFYYTDGKADCIIASAEWTEEGELEVDYALKREILNWGMTFNGDFYYQDIRTDRHWDAVGLLRLGPVDKALYDLNAMCIMPIGYHSVNAFLCDWDTSDYGDLCFNDLFEHLYWAKHSDYVYARDFEQESDPYPYACIPAELFENTILPYFDIALTDFREKTLYDAARNIYPWQEVSAFNIMYYPSIIPEVTKAEENSDGSITITVNVMCLDKLTDCLFIHEVTIMPSEDGAFRYLSNRVTYKGEHELPFDQARISVQRASSD